MRTKQSTFYRKVETCGVLITIDNYTVNTVNEVIYLGSAITIKQPKIMSIWTSNAGSFLPTGVTHTAKLIFYKTPFLPVLLYGAKAWTQLSTDAAALRVFDRKSLRMNFRPLRVEDDFLIRSNSELYELFYGMEVVKRTNIQQLG